VTVAEEESEPCGGHGFGMEEEKRGNVG